jgi:hypothetical protein
MQLNALYEMKIDWKLRSVEQIGIYRLLDKSRKIDILHVFWEIINKVYIILIGIKNAIECTLRKENRLQTQILVNKWWFIDFCLNPGQWHHRTVTFRNLKHVFWEFVYFFMPIHIEMV